MKSFKEWLLQREANSHTRARKNAANGQMPDAAVGSLHGTNTASPFEVKKLSRKGKKKEK